MSQNENNKEVLTEEAKATEGKKNDKAKKPSKPKKVEIKKPQKAEKKKPEKKILEPKAKKKAEKPAAEPEVKEEKPTTDMAKKKADKPQKKEKKPIEKPQKKEKKPSENKEKSKAEKKKPEPKKKSTESKTEKKSADKWNMKHIGGYLFAKMMRGGASELQAKAEEVNQLNVFPVPDGDTGDNMSMTIQSGVASLDNIDTDDLAEVLKVASRGMLLGARGNSGVILSQFFAGMAKGLENVEKADAKKLAHALELGVEKAYTSVMTPTEGTILTVAREAVEYAVSRVNSKSTVQSLFSDLVNEMNASLARTPDILPALGEAGVVDSGGAGLLYIIDGLNRVLNGEDVEFGDSSSLPKPKPAAPIDEAFGPDSEMAFGYCTELLVQLMNKKILKYPFDLDALKEHLLTLGDSIVCFQTETIVKVHIHTLRPDRVMRHLQKYGEFISVKIENMSVQHTELKMEEEIKPKKKYGIVAVSNGEGISNLFTELGADQIVVGGQTNNPSTNDFIDAFGNVNAENIFVFPNNGNIVMAASQAAEIYEEAKVFVVPSKSIGAGYVSLASMNFDSSEPEDLMKEAEEAIGRITSARVSPAIRNADMNGLHVAEGDTIGIIEKEIVISGPDKMVSTYGLLDIMLAEHERYMVTIFHGKDATTEERDMLADYMMRVHPNIEAYYVDGGQDIYPFLIVAE